ncbi:MAG: oligonucleotide/oligosaccharide-binding fold domain-containing protein [Phycisphaerales bacterium]
MRASRLWSSSALRVRESEDSEHGPRLELTDLGRQLARLPVDPRIGRIILAGADEQCLRKALIIASALSIQDPRERPAEQRDQADRAHEPFTHEGSDFLSYLLLWDAFHEQKGTLGSSRLKKWCVERFLNYVRLREWIETHDMLARLAREVGLAGSKGSKKCDDPDAIHRALLTALLSNIGYRPEKYEYEGPGNSRFYLFPGSALFDERPKWVVAAEIVETERRYARTVGPIQPKWVEEVGTTSSLAPTATRSLSSGPARSWPRRRSSSPASRSCPGVLCTTGRSIRAPAANSSSTTGSSTRSGRPAACS